MTKGNKPTNKVTLYRQGCIQLCDMYVELLKKNDLSECPKKVHPFEGMDTHDGCEDAYCNNVIECAKCRDKHYEDMKDAILAQYEVRRTWRDK